MTSNTSSIPRLVIKWLQSLDLSCSVRNARHDISNGYIIAEIFSRYYPHAVSSPLATNGTSLATKLDNWDQLERFFRKNDIDVPRVAIDAVIHGHPGAAVMFLENLYMLLTGKNLVRTSTLRPTTADYLSLASSGMIRTGNVDYQNAEANGSTGGGEIGRGNESQNNADYPREGDDIIDHRSPTDTGAERVGQILREPDHAIESLNANSLSPTDVFKKNFSSSSSNMASTRPRAHYQNSLSFHNAASTFPHYALPTTSKLIKSIPNSELVMTRDLKGVTAKARAILETQKSASRNFRAAAMQEGLSTNNGTSTLKPHLAASKAKNLKFQGATCLKKPISATISLAPPVSGQTSYHPAPLAEGFQRSSRRMGGDTDGGKQMVSV